MEIPPSRLALESHIDTHPLLMERSENYGNDHVIDMTRSADATSSSSRSRPFNGVNASLQEDRPSTSARLSTSRPSIFASNGSNSRNSSSLRRGESRRRNRSPLNPGLWISIELVLTISQIIAAIVVLSLSRNEQPQTPLFAWIVGYASGCAATIPFLYWRYRHRNQVLEQDTVQSHQNSQINVPAGPFSLSVNRTAEGEDGQTAPFPRRSNRSGTLNTRHKVLAEYFKMALDIFFAVWFVVGNVWVFGGNSSANTAPNLYRLCIAFLAISCVGYALPFILCASICCCLPCIISVLGMREDLSQTRGATPEAIDALPTYKFKFRRNKTDDDRDSNSSACEGGVIAAGTEKEDVISGEDAECCICLTKYTDNDELRELPCSHFFHKECVDKWLKINALCPLCKSEIGESSSGSPSETNASQQLGGSQGLLNTDM